MAENQEYQNKLLGELSDDLIRERGDFGGRELYQSDIGTYPASDIRSGDYPGVTGQDVPSFQTTVQSTFDTRPVNATDFYSTTQGSATNDPCTGTEIMTLFEFLVPAGYVAVVRNIELENVFGGTFEDNVPDTMTLTAFVDSTPQVGLNQIEVPVDEYNYVCHFLADENQTISVVLDGYTLLVGQTLTLSAIMRGNLLLKRGIPLNYEVGTT